VSPAFRCARASADRNEPIAGTASTVRAFLLVEDPGPWGVNAVADCRLPDDVCAALAERAAGAGVRVLLIRRHGRSAPEEPRVFAAFTDRSGPWVETGRVPDPRRLLDLDLAAVGAGRSPGLERYDGPLFLVCTHGRHDACCAERGRPSAAALSAVEPEATWEVSHIGGDRFAGNMLVLPEGIYYGRLTPEAAIRTAQEHRAGRLHLPYVRGRSSSPFAVQAAEAYLRDELGEARLGAVSPLSAQRTDAQTAVVFEVAARSDRADRADRAGRWQVTVRGSRTEPAQLTCRATHASSAPGHGLIAITRV
jgi:hypothetical protein